MKDERNIATGTKNKKMNGCDWWECTLSLVDECLEQMLVTSQSGLAAI